MIQQESVVRIADNTGAKKALCIRVLGGSGRRYARVGDRGGPDRSRTRSPTRPVKKGEVACRPVIVRTEQGDAKAKTASYIRFDDNAAVLINPNGEPRGTRIFRTGGP